MSHVESLIVRLVNVPLASAVKLPATNTGTANVPGKLAMNWPNSGVDEVDRVTTWAEAAP